VGSTSAIETTTVLESKGLTLVVAPEIRNLEGFSCEVLAQSKPVSPSLGLTPPLSVLKERLVAIAFKPSLSEVVSQAGGSAKV